MSNTTTPSIASRSAAAGPRPFQGLGAMVRYQFRHTVLYPAQWAFSIGFPIIMYVMFGAFQSYAKTWPDGAHANVSAAIMFGMGAYGATLAAASIGAQVGIERAQGWARQVALTPMRSGTYFVGKIVLSLAAAVFSILALVGAGALMGAKADVEGWIFPPMLIILGCMSTATMGVMVGYLVRSDAAYSIIGGGSAILAFVAGIWIPIDQMPSFFQNLAPFTPLHGIYHLSQWPLKAGAFQWSWVASIAAWTIACGAIALWRMRKSTARV